MNKKKMNDFDEWIRERNKKNGYIFCQQCTNETGGEIEVWHNPKRPCKHMKGKKND